VLIDWFGMSAEEVALVMRIKASTVRVHLSRGRGSLRELMKVCDG
jgi:DNA-directed RNA polymerase specialized sigma24 family protein